MIAKPVTSFALSLVLTLGALHAGAQAAPTTDPTAKPLPAGEQARLDTCKGFETERATLFSAGVPADLERGPEWARVNLPATRIQQILRYIHLDEQVRFRCADVFATAAVREAEEAARIAAAKALAAQKAWEARQAEILRNIPPPDRKPRRTASKQPKPRFSGVTPPLPERFRR